MQAKLYLAAHFFSGYRAGMEKLKTYLATRRKADFAREIGTSPTYLSHILAGRKFPSFGLMVKIKKASGGAVRLDDWVVTPEETTE